MNTYILLTVLLLIFVDFQKLIKFINKLQMMAI